MPKSSPLVFTFCVLVGINTMNFFDRQVLAAVQEKIRKDWDLSDSELGWLGTAFILLYAVVGLPLGRLADRWNRRVAPGRGRRPVEPDDVRLRVRVGVSGRCSCSGSAVGIGEATCAPTASSLIGDLVPAERRARAMSIFMLGLPLGLALSFFVSGAVAQRHGWQAAFFVAGVPGLVLAVAALFILDPVAAARTAGHAPTSSVCRSGWWPAACSACRRCGGSSSPGRCTTSTCTRWARSWRRS